ncbi:MAG: hypothetical protein ACYC4Q_07535 [Victivallaceae bacterium]
MGALDLVRRSGIKLQKVSQDKVQAEPEKKYGPTLTLAIEMEKQHRAESNQAGFKIIPAKE